MISKASQAARIHREKQHLGFGAAVNDIDQMFKEKLAASGLTLQEATKLLQFELCRTAAQAPPKLSIRAPGFKIPYFDFDGKQTGFYRYRFLPEVVGRDEKPLKYLQEKDTLNELYLPPFCDWRKIADDPTIEIIITEGELKAACATKRGFPTIGLGGIWCWRAAKQGFDLLPQFSEFVWASGNVRRRVIIAFDRDAP